MSKKPKARKLTELESVIMEAVWTLEKATVREVQEHLSSARPMARNTVLTMMGILRDKGFLASTRMGRSDVYRPTASREQVSKHLLHDLVSRFFSGSAGALVSQLLESEDLNTDELKAIRRDLNHRIKD